MRWWLRWRFRRQYHHLVDLHDGMVCDHPALLELHGSVGAYQAARVTALLIQMINHELAKRRG